MATLVIGTSNLVLNAVQLSPPGQFLDIAVGANFGLGIRPDGTLEAWGFAAPPNIPPGQFIAVDAGRGWMLMRDGGEQLRASIRPTQDTKPWESVITRYAELQIGLAEHVDEILALGIPDHRLAVLPSLYSQLLADEESMMIDRFAITTCPCHLPLVNLKPATFNLQHSNLQLPPILQPLSTFYSLSTVHCPLSTVHC